MLPTPWCQHSPNIQHQEHHSSGKTYNAFLHPFNILQKCIPAHLVGFIFAKVVLHMHPSIVAKPDSPSATLQNILHFLTALSLFILLHCLERHLFSFFYLDLPILHDPPRVPFPSWGTSQFPPCFLDISFSKVIIFLLLEALFPCVPWVTQILIHNYEDRNYNPFGFILTWAKNIMSYVLHLINICWLELGYDEL